MCMEEGEFYVERECECGGRGRERGVCSRVQYALLCQR